jgi:radical SAM superfamily enzyme YgiQ (UPF0313 family)
MKILLLNPPAENTLQEYPDPQGGSYVETEDFGYFPPLGLLYVLSYAEQHTSGHEFYFLDCVAEKIAHDQISAYVSQIQPVLVGITSFTIALIDVCLAAQTIRDTIPQAHLCLGGHHTIAFPVQAARLEEFDSIIVGEGEIAFTQLIRAIEAGGDITRIPGVYTADLIEAFRSEPFQDSRFLGNVVIPPAYIEDIDALPIPNRSYIKHIRYNSIVGISGHLATMITSRGCPCTCTFCDVPYKKYRERATGHVVDEIEACLEEGYQEIHFYDDLFNITPQKVLRFCDEVERRKLRFHWDFRGRVNTVTKESLARAKQAGCRLISFGVETGTDRGLQLLHKGTTVQKVREVFRWCRELHIKTIADFMIGLPFEKTRDDVLRNIDFLIGLDADYAQFAILCLYPHTEVYEQAVEKGLVQADKWEHFASQPTREFIIDYWTEFLSSQELIELQKLGYRKYYLRPSYIVRNILNTRSLYEFTTKAKGALKLLG